MKKVVIFDLDGTITEDFDFLHYLSSLNGFEKESINLINKGKGIKYLNQRLKLLKGLTKIKIEKNIKDKIILKKGIKTFFKYLNKNNYIKILITGSPNIILNYLHKDINFDYIIAPKINFNKNGVVKSVEKLEKDFKLMRIKKLIKKFNLKYKDLIYFDDSDYAENLMTKVGLGFTVGNKKIKGSKYSINNFKNILKYF